MNLEKEVKLLREENEILKAKLVEYMETISKLEAKISKSRGGRSRIVTEDVESNIIDLRKSGKTIRNIAATINVSIGSVHSVLKKHGIESK